MMENLAARALLALIWLLHWLPLGVQAVLGRGLGRVMHALARGRRAVALRNVEPVSYTHLNSVPMTLPFRH